MFWGSFSQFIFLLTIIWQLKKYSQNHPLKKGFKSLPKPSIRAWAETAFKCCNSRATDLSAKEVFNWYTQQVEGQNMYDWLYYVSLSATLNTWSNCWIHFWITRSQRTTKGWVFYRNFVNFNGPEITQLKRIYNSIILKFKLN